VGKDFAKWAEANRLRCSGISLQNVAFGSPRELESSDIADHILEIFESQRLYEEGMSPHSIGALNGIAIGTGEDYDRGRESSGMGFEPMKYIEAGAVREMEIEQHQNRKRIALTILIDSFAFKIADRVVDRLDGLNGIKDCISAEHMLKQFDIALRVIDDKDCGGARGLAR